MEELLKLCAEFPDVLFVFRRVPEDQMRDVTVIRVYHIARDGTRRELPVYVSDGERNLRRANDRIVLKQLREAAMRVLRGE